jgi:chemotaxis protein MotB
MAGRKKKGRHGGGHENHERWLITYADLITLLMVFFVLLYSMANADSTKFRMVSAALSRAFNVDVFKGATASGMGGEGGSGASLGLGEGGASTALEDLLAQSDSISPLVSRLASALQPVVRGDAAPQALPAPDVSILDTAEGVVVRLSGSFLFESGRAELKPNALPILDALATELRALSKDVRVDGHTDNVPLDSPRYATNWELSGARAFAVVRYLAEIGGVPATRLTAAGFGEFRPLVDNNTREHRALNRRVEVRILTSPFAPVEIQAPPTAPAADVPVASAGSSAPANSSSSSPGGV